MKNRILVGVVTYNRLELLKRCIYYINKQTFQNFELLIVNNGSDDGTSDYLLNNKIKHINNIKSGSALGWYTALEYSYKNNYDLVWLMDDDGFPEKNSLEILLNSIDINVHACLSSLVVKENNPNSLVFPLPITDKNQHPVFNFISKGANDLRIIKNQSKKNLYNFVHLFNGALINLKITKQIINVNLDYFHHGVELDYYYRLSKKGKMFTHCKSLQYHPDVSKRILDIYWIFYYVKNSIIINKLYLNQPLLRNLKVVLASLIRIIIRNGMMYFLFNFIFNKNIKIFIRAIKDGFNIKYSKL